MIFKTNYNSHKFDSNYEVNNQPSETVPDQTMSISEIMRRFASGLPLGGQKVEFFEGEDDFLDGVNPATLDLAEKQQISESVRDELAAIKDRQQKRNKQKEDKKLHQQFLKEQQEKFDNEKLSE